MTPESVDVMGTAMKIVPPFAAPLLLVAPVTGLIISILPRPATQVNENDALVHSEKIIAVFVAIIVAGPWILNLLLDYIRNLFTNLPYIIGRRDDLHFYQRPVDLVASGSIWPMLRILALITTAPIESQRKRSLGVK